jgi:hypothetical protein
MCANWKQTMNERCRFCDTFWKIPKKQWEYDKRLCPVSGKLVAKHNGCPDMTLAAYVRCIGWNYQLPLKACLNNYLTKAYPRCRKCVQGKQLDALFYERRQKKPIVATKKQRKPIIIGGK